MPLPGATGNEKISVQFAQSALEFSGQPLHPLPSFSHAAIMPSMRRQRKGFNPRRFEQSGEVQLVTGFFVILFVVGGGLIWAFYGPGPALMGAICMLGGLIFFLLLFGLVWLLGRWAGE